MTKTQFEERVQPILDAHSVELAAGARRNCHRESTIKKLYNLLRNGFNAIDAMLLETELDAWLADRVART